MSAFQPDRANGRFDVSGSSVKIGLNGKNSTYGVCLPQIAQGHFIAEVTADKTTNFGLAIVREKNGNRISIIILR